MFVWGGGGGLAAVTSLCKTWENSIVFFESLINNISESSLQNIKKKQLDTKTSLSIRIPYLFHTFILLRLPCIENLVENTQISA